MTNQSTASSSMLDASLQARLRQRFNPDGSKLRRHQLLMLEMLKKIDRICRENGIRYWLSSGTCIGALRHGGFIPWDDDVDIEMLEGDFIRLRDIMASYPADDMAWQDAATDRNYVQPFAKIRDVNTEISEDPFLDTTYRYRGVYIDVFALRPSSSCLLYRMCCKIQGLFLYRAQYIRNDSLRRRVLGLSRMFVTNGIFRILSAVGRIGHGNRYRHLPGTSYSKPRFLEDIASTRLVKFEDTLLPVPVNAEHYLEKIYGDYRSLPPLDSIHPHVSEVKWLSRTQE